MWFRRKGERKREGGGGRGTKERNGVSHIVEIPRHPLELSQQKCSGQQQKHDHDKNKYIMHHYDV